MSVNLPFESRPPQSLNGAIAALRHRAGWIIAFGVVVAALGALAFSSVLLATLVSVYVVGIMMLLAGAAEVAMGFHAKSWSRFLVWVLLGLIYLGAGISVLMNPLLAAGLLTLFLGIFLIVGGLMRIFLGFQMKAGSSWRLVVLSGTITTLLGIIILAHWPVSSLYVLGVFLSLDLMFAGIGWIGLGMALRRHSDIWSAAE